MTRDFLELQILNMARLFRRCPLIRTAAFTVLGTGILLPSDWTLSYAFAKQIAVPVALVALSGLLLASYVFDGVLTRMDTLARTLDGGRGLDRNLVFLAPQMREAYDQWSKKCANQRMVEWLAILVQRIASAFQILFVDKKH
jgi:hypothetical protein